MYRQIARNKRRSIIVVVVFFVIWVGIGALVGALLSWRGQSVSTAPTTTTSFDPGPMFVGMAIAGALAAIAVVHALSRGTNLVLATSGATPADPTRYQQLHNIVEALAIGDGLPKPAVYVIDDPSPNAFATGTSPDRATITATTGLLNIMNREEIEGVISHEMSHIKNYDVRLILMVTTLLGLAGLLASVMWRAAIYGRFRGRDGAQIALVVYATAALLVVVAVVIGPLIQLALSRSRESLADVSGVELTRNPVGLVHALQKLQQNDKPFAKFNHASAAMCIDDPLQHHERWFHHLFDTHPPISERIAVLEKIAEGRVV